MTTTRTHYSLIQTAKNANFPDLKNQILSLPPLNDLGLPEDEKTDENVFQSILTNKNLNPKEQEELLILLLYDRAYIACHAADCLLLPPLIDLMLKDMNFSNLVVRLFAILIAENRRLRQEEEDTILLALSQGDRDDWQTITNLMHQHRTNKDPLKVRLKDRLTVHFVEASQPPKDRLKKYRLVANETHEQFWNHFKDAAEIAELTRIILSSQSPTILEKYLVFSKLNDPQALLDLYSQNQQHVSPLNTAFLWNLIVKPLLQDAKTCFDFYMKNMKNFSKENELIVWNLLLDKSKLDKNFIWSGPKDRLAQIFKSLVATSDLKHLLHFGEYWLRQCQQLDEPMATYQLIKNMIQDTKFASSDTYFHKMAKQRILQMALDKPELVKESKIPVSELAPNVEAFLAKHRPSKFGMFQRLYATSSTKTYQKIQNGKLAEAKVDIKEKEQKLTKELSKTLVSKTN